MKSPIYQDTNTGCWNGIAERKPSIKHIKTNLFDDEGNSYPVILELEVTDFTVTVARVGNAFTSVVFNNPHEDIRNAIRLEGFKSQEIKF